MVPLLAVTLREPVNHIRGCDTKCKEDAYDHFRNHLDIHSLCKFCSYQLATLNDSRFWEKVCNKCGKIMTSQKSLNWHKKIHNPISDQQCPYCEVKLRRKFTFIRHMKEEHGEEEKNR